MTRRWFDRTFPSGAPAEALPWVIERLRGTPARLEERLLRLDLEALTARPGDAWSILENAGHLVDLEPLWLGRVEDFAAGRDTLRPADLENAATEEANHNESGPGGVLLDFRTARETLVERLESLDEAGAARTALHPRLETPMNVTDLAFFVAEHDDHHLARITALVRELGA